MLRWLFRLVVLGLIGLGIAFAVSRLMDQDEDFDDYDDIEAGFEFQETPVEIDVPANTGDNATKPPRARKSAAADAKVGGDDGSTSASFAAATGTSTAGSLVDVNGIGPNYAARLEAAGIATLGDLANANAEEIASKMDVIGGSTAIEDWIAQAKSLTSASNGKSA